MDIDKLKQDKREYFKPPLEGESLQHTEKFFQDVVEAEDVERQRDYWVVVNEWEEIDTLTTKKKGLVDEMDILQGFVDEDYEIDYYCYKITYAEHRAFDASMMDVSKMGKPGWTDHPTLPDKAPIPATRTKDTGCLTGKRELKGHLNKKPGENFLKCTPLNRVSRPLGMSIAEARQEQPAIVSMELANIVMIGRISYEVGSRIEISFKGSFAKALPGRLVHLVRIAIDQREGEYMRRIIKTEKIADDFKGVFQMFAKDRVERIDQIYQVILESKIEGGTGCGIREKVLLIEEMDCSKPKTLSKGYFDR